MRHRIASVLAVVLLLPPLSGCLTSQVIGHHPEWRKLAGLPEDEGMTADLVRFRSLDGLTLTGWWVSGKGDPQATIVLVHGMAGNRSHMLGRAKFLVDASHNVLAIDLRAHGDSEGNYMTPGYKEADDVLAAVQFLRAAPFIGRAVHSPSRGDSGEEGEYGQRIVLFGYSYGAVAVLHAASRCSQVAAVIADAPFISYTDVMHRFVALVRNDPNASLGSKIGIGLLKLPGMLWLTGVEFYFRTGVNLNAEKIDAVHAVREIKQLPVLFLAGENDPIAPPANTHKLFDATSSSTKSLFIIPQATHATFTKDTREFYEQHVLEFLSRLNP